MKPEWTGLDKLLVANAINKAKTPETYITDGLVLWMDGIDKGSTPGAWTDKAAGYVFTNVNGFEDGSNYVGLNSSSSQYFSNTSFSPVNDDTGTIEVVMSDYSNRALVFMPKSLGMLAFGVFGSTDQIISSTSEGKYVINFTTGAKIFSIVNNTRAMVDGALAQLGSENAWGGDDNINYIGRRSSGNYFTGKIYAIRMYNRQLTQEEMLHNQRLDNKRFNLGLPI